MEITIRLSYNISIILFPDIDEVVFIFPPGKVFSTNSKTAIAVLKDAIKQRRNNDKNDQG